MSIKTWMGPDWLNGFKRNEYLLSRDVISYCVFGASEAMGVKRALKASQYSVVLHPEPLVEDLDTSEYRGWEANISNLSTDNICYTVLSVYHAIHT